MWVLIAAILGSAMAIIDTTAVNVALPVMQRDLSASAAGLQWIVESYTLFLSALILVGGSFGDRFGRRAIFLLGAAIFTLSSLACALAPTLPFLIAARSIQGIGAALLMPGSLSLITVAFSGEARGRAIGTWSGFTSIMAAIGPVLGGWLAQAISWRAVFLINIPLGIIVLILTRRCVVESRDDAAPRSIDVAGATLITLGLGALVYGLISLQSAQRDTLGLAIAVVGGILIAAFIYYERRISRDPMLQADLFESRPFTGANLYTFLLYAGLSGSLYFMPFDLINVQGYPPVAAGASLLPFIIIMFTASRWSGGLVVRIGAKKPLVIGALLAAAGFALFAVPGVGGSYWTTFFPAAVVLGCGGAFFVAPLTTTAMNAVSAEQAGIASGINNAVARTAGLIAIAGLGLALASTFEKHLDAEVTKLNLTSSAIAQVDRERGKLLSGQSVDLRLPGSEMAGVTAAIRTSYVAGFRETMILAAMLALCAAIVAAVWDLRVPGREAGAAVPPLETSR
ncbi:MAG: MFS transporter [Vulcanimicrobiaceae bacterium]|jgi:EmrB/QacA subfamily drug resistance transporter